MGEIPFPVYCAYFVSHEPCEGIPSPEIKFLLIPEVGKCTSSVV